MDISAETAAFRDKIAVVAVRNSAAVRQNASGNLPLMIAGYPRGSKSIDEEPVFHYSKSSGPGQMSKDGVVFCGFYLFSRLLAGRKRPFIP